MSAYICSLPHLRALAIYAGAHDPNDHGRPRVDPRYVEGCEYALTLDSPPELMSYYADLLYQENIRSVRARYPDDSWDDLPGPKEKPQRLSVTEADIRASLQAGGAPFGLQPVDILKMCAGWEYQSCETADMAKTVAYRIIEAIRRAAIRELPGYEAAPWDFSGERVTS